MKILFTLIIFTFSFTIAFSQESVIIGHVIDSKTGEALSFASVKMNQKNITKADSLGNFNVKVEAGKYRVTISKIGYLSLYQTVRIGFEEKLNIDFRLESFVNELNQVVVSSSKQERVLAQEAVSITNIQPYLITNTNSNNLSDVLNKVPGISVIEGQAIIRGSASYSYNVGSRVMVVLDGMPLMGPDVGDIQWDLLPIEAAENIEVLKGPSSVLYGSSASSGTVTLNTGWPTNKPETKIQTYQGITGDPRTKQGIWWENTSQPFNSGTFFSHKQKFGQFDLVTSGNVDMNRSFIQLNDSYRARMYAKTRYRFKSIKGLTAGVNGNVMFKKAGRFFLWAGGDSGLYKPYNRSTGQDFYSMFSVNPYITYTRPDNYTISLRLLHYNITRYVDSTHYARGQNNAVANTQSIDLNIQKKWFKGFNTNTGIFLSRIWATGNVYPGDHYGYSAAAFTQADYQYKRWNMNAGMRYEFNALGTIEETPRPLLRAGVNFKAAKQTYLRATYGEGYRFPTIAERYVDDNVGSIRIFPNPDLKSETGWYTEFGIKQGVAIGSNFNAMFDFAFFWQEYRNLIEFHFDQWSKPYLDTSVFPPAIIQGQNGFKAVNIDYSRTAGAELTVEGSGKINDLEVRTLCGYTYIYPVDLNADPSQRDFGTYMNNFFSAYNGMSDAQKASTLTYRNTKLVKADIEFGYKKFILGYAALYYSTFDKVDPRLYDIVQVFMTNAGAGVWIQNVRLGYQISNNVTVAFLVNNIDNIEYAIRPARMEPPRNFNIQFRMNF